MNIGRHDRVRLRLAWGQITEARVVEVTDRRVLVAGERYFQQAIRDGEEPLAELSFPADDVIGVMKDRA